MAEHNAAGQTQRLAALRRLDSADKTHRVLATLDITLSTGEPLTIAALARRAGVSRRFIYDHPELRAEAKAPSAEAASHHTAATTASARVTVASLRADLANAKAANHRLTTELAALGRRLGQLLGQDALAGLDHATIETNATQRPAGPARTGAVRGRRATRTAHRGTRSRPPDQPRAHQPGSTANVADHEAGHTPVPRRPLCAHPRATRIRRS